MAQNRRKPVVMDDIPRITVHVDGNGALLDVNVDGHRRQTTLIETKQSRPTPSFGDEEYKERVRPWLAGG
jgi:hypothetical protein